MSHNEKLPNIPSNSPELLLTILCQGRNTNNDNFAWQLSTVLNKHAENIMFLGLEQQVEILVSDWGNESLLYAALELNEHARRLVKFLIVPPEVAASSAGNPISTAINSVARRARGKYVMFSDSDIFIPIETMAKLVYYLNLGYFHSFNVSNSFFWASKYLVPRNLIADSPYREHLEEHIVQHGSTYVHENVITDNFLGSGACLLMSRETWFESTGFNEQLISSNEADIDFTRRLLLTYRWDDLENHGMTFFKYEPPHDTPLNSQDSAETAKSFNLGHIPAVINANAANWGLADHNLAFADGYGLAIARSSESSRNSFDRHEQLQSVDDIIASDPRYLGIESRFAFNPHSFYCNGEAVQALLSALQPETVCEIGSWMGASARSFAAHSSVKQVACVDHWDRYRIEKYKPGVHPEHMVNNMYEQFLANAVHSGTSGKICPIRLDSDTAAAYCLEMNRKFDLIYVDGDHTTVGARADILKWLPLLIDGGYMCGDDWTWQKEPDNVAGAAVSVAKAKGFQVFFHGNFWLLIPGEFSIQPLTMEVLRGIKPISRSNTSKPISNGKQPLVSIFCTCRNAETTIHRHIKAVLAAMQQYENMEYVVQDGNSTDATLSIFEEYREEFGDKLRLISAPDSCCEEGFWLALSRCRGEILCASLADEEILSDAIPFVVEQFQQDPSIDVIHGNIYQTDIDGNIQFENPSKKFNLSGYISHQIPMHLAASFFRRSAFFKASLLPFPSKYGLLKDDFFTWIYLGLSSNINYYPAVFAKYAVHENALSIRSDRVADNMSQRNLFIENIFRSEELPDEVRANKKMILANFYKFAINILNRSNLVSEAQCYVDALTKLSSNDTLYANNIPLERTTDSPILFIVFNRPETTVKVFESIRSARPRRLYIAADGPRNTVPLDVELCAKTREIMNCVDWPCEVKTLLRDGNLGCKYSVSSAITWFFEYEQEGIILEDDCLPDMSFFRYCDELLEKHRNDSRIGMISGDNFQFGRKRPEASYYFSRFTHIWGWATWRRAWEKYDVEMTQWPHIRDTGFINDILDTHEEVDYWTSIFESTYAGHIDTWDYQLMLSSWINGFLNILPCQNLVKNIGFDTNGAHTTNIESPFSNMETMPIQFPLKHPQNFIRDAVSDIYSASTTFGIPIPDDVMMRMGFGSQHQSNVQGGIMHSDDDVEVSDLQDKATRLFNDGKYEAALDYVIAAKATKESRRGVDLLRARCFMQLGQTMGAVEALREELRWFPDNVEARTMLDSLLTGLQKLAVTSNYEPDFTELLDVIRPYTMLSEQRLYSLYMLARHVCENSIQGNFVECGVAAGGSSALLAWVIKKYSAHPRSLFSFDSFSGMPRPTEFDSSGGVDAESTGWGTGTCSAPEASVREICTKLGVDDVLITVKGYFEETLPQMRDWVGMVALLHMDGDWYESTRSILNNLYDRLVNRAVIQVDDYGYWDGCRKAIYEFTTARALQLEINQIDGTGVWFVKPDAFRINKTIPRSLVADFMQDDPVPQGIVSQMSANERFQLYYSVRNFLPIHNKVLRFIEIGSYSGASLVLTCHALQRLGVTFQGISVEPGGTSQFHEVIKILATNVIHLPMFSHDASLRLGIMFDAENLPEFIFVDGDHTYEGVKQDIIDYYQLLAPGGIILFHDYLPELDDKNRAAIHHHHGNAEPGIRRACMEVLEGTHQLIPIELPLLYPEDPTQTQAHLPIIPGVFSTVRAYRKPL